MFSCIFIKFFDNKICLFVFDHMLNFVACFFVLLLLQCSLDFLHFTNDLSHLSISSFNLASNQSCELFLTRISFNCAISSITEVTFSVKFG